MIRLLALLVVFASPAVAETARVLSGEHADFTRLVVELPEAGDWTLGRTATGYAFLTKGNLQQGYDLSQVWTRIPRTRLQSLAVDPDSGWLQLSLACPCHVFPFEYRPGVIVLDIKDGPAPPGSAFEALLDAAPVLVASVTGYDWLDAAKAPQPVSGPTPLPMPLVTGAVSLDPLRDALLEQISRGAAEGVVEMTLPRKRATETAADGAELPWAQIRIGEMPGVAVAAEDPADTLPDGAACIADDLVALPDWGAGRPALELLAEARQGLFTEFDTLDADALLRGVRLHLYLGFGAEALQYARLIGTEAPEELRLYRSMARIIDGEQDPETPFAAMLGCDGVVALWAALAHSRLPPGDGVNARAVVRSFAALPPHLRRHLGPSLAEKFLERDDPDSARMIRDALERTPDMPGAAIALLDADAALQADRPMDAAGHAADAVTAGEGGAAALVTLVEAHYRQADPLAPEIAASLQSYLGEGAGGTDAPGLQRAFVLALGLSGQTDAAFAAAGPGGVLPELWHVTQQRATDDDFLTHAVLPPGAVPPDTGGEVATAVADRLLRLGFADAALVWLGTVAPDDSDARRRIAAAAELGRGDARAALTHLTGLAGPEVADLQARALVQLQSLGAARAAFEAAGRPDDAARLLGWEGDWAGVHSAGAAPWAAAAAYAVPPPAHDGGPLARGAALLDDSAAARLAITGLLETVAMPRFP